MPFGLLKSLFGAPNPTRDWPPSDGTLPEINAHTYAFGRLRFGDPLDAAMFLGRPDKYEVSKNSPTWVTLEYHSGAVLLYFSSGQFCGLHLGIGIGGEFKRKASDPSVIPTLTSSERFTRDTSRTEVEQIFGAPHDVYDPLEHFKPDELDNEGLTLNYEFSPVTLEFEFNAADQLVAWNIDYELPD